MKTATKLKTVYSVIYYDGRFSGPAGDGTFIARFRSRRNAEQFACGRECYGKPATVETEEVPPRIADRWSYHG